MDEDLGLSVRILEADRYGVKTVEFTRSVNEGAPEEA